jgi:molybdopterin converting factor small subunit
MKRLAGAVSFLVLGAGAAWAQDDAEKKVEELKRQFQKSMGALEERFSAEKDRMEKHFKSALEKLTGKKEKEEPKEGRDLDKLVDRILKRLDRLEGRLEGLKKEMPRWEENFRDLPRLFEEFMPRFFGEGEGFDFRKFMPRFRDFEFGPFRRDRGDDPDEDF